MAAALAIKVFPVPGGPVRSTPLRGRMPKARVLELSVKKESASRNSRLAISWPPMSANVTAGILLSSFDPRVFKLKRGVMPVRPLITSMPKAIRLIGSKKMEKSNPDRNAKTTKASATPKPTSFNHLSNCNHPHLSRLLSCLHSYRGGSPWSGYPPPR